MLLTDLMDRNPRSEQAVAFQELVRSRRSIRNFQDRPVPSEFLSEILEAGRLAPSRANSQPWRFIVVTDSQVKRQLFDAVYHQQMVLDAPVLITILGIIDPRASVPDRTIELVQAGCFGEDVKNLADHVLDHWDHSDLKTDAALNSAIAGAQMGLAAHALGLGCVWIKLCHDDQVLRILQVPDGHYHTGTLAIGYPTSVPPARPRLPLSELVRYNSFDNKEPIL